MDNNVRLKEIMYQYRIPQRLIADKLGVSDVTVFRKLSRPMPEELYKTYLNAIEDIIKDNSEKKKALEGLLKENDFERVHKTT